MIKLEVKTKTLLADTLTPVSLYMRIRDEYPKSILLESNDYQAKENSISFICFDPLATFKLEDEKICQDFPDGTKSEAEAKDVHIHLEEFFNSFDLRGDQESKKLNGLFGYMTYDAVRYFENIEIQKAVSETKIPEIQYSLFRYIIAINHFTNQLTLIENVPENNLSQFEKIEILIKKRTHSEFYFQTTGSTKSSITDNEFMELVEKGRHHCKIGDTFQVVFSRRFSQTFQGDEFNVYRSLRSINPSPYLFYFDYGNFRLLGSSPESQLVIKNNKASIIPIAGTVKRSGNDEEDQKRAYELANDEKENAEHIMLVDLARNDLGRFASKIQVEKYKEIQFYSHVLHMVSSVSGIIPKGSNRMKMLGTSYPAGTLSGAPKIKAMELINRYESVNRSFYGGCIGQISFNGDINHAIIIRSILSKGNSLFYQAGAGILVKSDKKKELEEVYHKVGA
ncbi:MAG: anthranilate synthase component I family protein, partial [Bacteroidales bacterium]|nr:anthranilate synthase component I family protein [Bacteroidales bacterium]